MKILNEEHFQNVKRYAESIGDTSLQNCLDRLKSWEDNPDHPSEISLYYDHAPYSFGFTQRYPDGSIGIVGGLLYHGIPDRSFAVTLQPFSINFIKFKIMEAMAVLEKQQQFDFQNNGIEVMNLETLQRTYKENDIYGKPVQGIYHYQVLQRMMGICEKYNLDYEVEEIFAAQNRNKTQPGVSILPQVEQTHGEKAVEAHILRRIFATIRIKDWETDELTTTLVVAYHQDGIQAAIGPCVKICHNQCILSPERSICNYGKNKVTTEGVFETVDGWLANFEVNMNEDIARIQRLKRRIVSLEEVYMYIGLLTALRVSHDSSDRNLSSSVETYPLNQSQISIFTEEVLKLAREKGQITAWDLYNVATEIYKPGRTDFPALIPQNGAMAELLLSRLPAEVEIQDAVLVS